MRRPPCIAQAFPLTFSRTSMSVRILLPLLFLALAALAGCDSNDGSDAGTRYGPAANVGEGTARTFVRTNEAGEPEALGVVLTADALDNLPDHGDHEENMLTLRFPDGAAVAPFDHVSFDWNPHGHEPEGLFTLPHFDVHFYMATEAERMTWMPSDPQWEEKLANVPAAKYVPAGFVQTPGGIPMMGSHWIDTADPTYAPGGTFSEVFLWGSYDGRVTFAEPMITLSMLEARTAVDEALAQPQAWATAGTYPTRYTVRYDAEREEYVVALEGLTRRTAS
jgi:hypothetical protein